MVVVLSTVRAELFAEQLLESPGLLSAIIVGTFSDERHHLANLTEMQEAICICLCISMQMPAVKGASGSQVVSTLLDEILRRADLILRQRLLRGLATFVRTAFLKLLYFLST